MSRLFSSLKSTVWRQSMSTNSLSSELSSIVIQRTTSCEPSEFYVGGGYHPVMAGERYNSQYKVLKKLGWGSRSTVWLVEDELNERLAAMKVLISGISTTEGLDEVNTLRTLQSSDPAAVGYRHVCQFLGDFTHSGPNGNHLCIVLEPMGVNLQDVYMSLPATLPTTLLKRFCVHTLSALQYLHDTCGLIHTDLKPDNIFLTGKPIAAGECVTLTVPGLNTAEFKLGDFGQSVNVSSHRHDVVIQPTKMRCPEVIVGGEWGTKADIFNFACMAYELARGAFLFDPTWKREETGMTAPQTHLAQMTGLLGNFPSSLLERGAASSRYFDESGHLKVGAGTYNVTLEDLLARANRSDSPHSMAAMADFLRCGLVIDPDQRWSAARLLEHPWLLGAL